MRQRTVAFVVEPSLPRFSHGIVKRIDPLGLDAVDLGEPHAGEILLNEGRHGAACARNGFTMRQRATAPARQQAQRDCCAANGQDRHSPRDDQRCAQISRHNDDSRAGADRLADAKSDPPDAGENDIAVIRRSHLGKPAPVRMHHPSAGVMAQSVRNVLLDTDG